MRGILLLLAICMLLLPYDLHAQEGQDDVIKFGEFFAKKAGGEVILRGTVTNPESGELLQGAVIRVPEINLGTKTNNKGEYFIFMPIGEYTVEVQYTGLPKMKQKIMIYDDGVLDFGLRVQAYSLREVIIEGTIDDQNVSTAIAGINELNIKEIRALPTFLGEVDVIKSLLLLPGVSTAGEGSSGFNVRGGGIDQNLLQLNGATLFNPSHVLGFFSAFNPDVIDKFTLYKGSIPAQFGGRASSVLDVFIKNGDFETYKFKGGIGMISSRFVAEGPIVSGKTSFLIGARASYSDWLLKLIKQPEIRQSSAFFYDANAIITHRFNFNHQLTFSYYSSQDFFRYSNEFGFEYGTQTANLTWKGIISDQFSTTTFVGFGDYKSQSFAPEGIEGFSLTNGTRYYQFKQNFLYVPGPHNMNVGLEANLYQMKPDDLRPKGPTSRMTPGRVEKDQGRELALYINDEYAITDRLSINLGLRYSVYQQIGEEQVFIYKENEARDKFNIIDTTFYGKGEVVTTYGGFEPRFSLRLKLWQDGALKLGYSRMRQYLHLVSNTAAPTPVDVWQVSTPYIPPQLADNLSIGLYQNFNRNVWETYLEFFYKETKNLIDYKDFASLFLNEHIETDLISGQGKAYGGELYIRRKAGRWTGWLSYTYSRSMIKLAGDDPSAIVNDGAWFPTSYDQPHTLTFIAKRQVDKRSFFSLNFTYRSGRPFTGIISNYVQNNSPIPHFSERNRYRIADYIRLDLSLLIAGKEKPNKKFDSNLALSVYNLLGRKNAFSVFYKLPDERIVIPKAFQLSVLGAPFPAVTYNFSF